MPKSNRVRLWSVVGIAGLLAVLIVFYKGSRSGQTSPNPMNSAGGAPFEAFAGSDRCVECHSEIWDRYSQAGHAHTFSLSSESDSARQLDGVTFEDTERDLKFQFHFEEKKGLSVSLPDRFGGEQFPLKYALGSNRHAQTFLQLMSQPTGETVGIELRVSVFGPECRLGLTAGHAGAPITEPMEILGMVVSQETVESCIGCHTTYFELQGRELVNVMPNVGCESCHGPGAQHVANMTEGLKETAIDALRDNNSKAAAHQIEACADCHRSPGELDPREITPGNTGIVRFQPVGLMQSECFKESKGTLSCTTCHNPHQRPEEQSGEVIQSCLDCHQPDHAASTACPVSPRSNCIECHMPQVEMLPGVFFHDHWIRVRAEHAVPAHD